MTSIVVVKSDDWGKGTAPSQHERWIKSFGDKSFEIMLICKSSKISALFETITKIIYLTLF